MKFRAASIVIVALALSSPTLPLAADDKPTTDKPADTKPAADKPPTDQPPATPPTGPRGGGFGRGGFGGGGGAGRGGPGGFGGGGGGAGGPGGGPGAPGAFGRFGPTIMRAQAQDPLDEIIQLLGELNLGPDFTLSAEQKQSIQTARDEYKKQMDHWRTDHEEELKKLEDEMTQARAAIAQNAAAGQPNTRQNLQQIAQARQELTDTAPRSDETIVQIKGTLTTDQLKRLQAKETDRQAENEKLRQQIMQQQQQRLGRGGGFGGGGGGGGGGGAGNGAAGGRGNPAGPGRGI